MKLKIFFKKLFCIFNCCNSSCFNKKEKEDLEDFKAIVKISYC